MQFSSIELSNELLLSVMKPARYIGEELGSVKKDLSAVDVKVCLCFPDIYEIGMSHMGLRILYDLINKRPNCAAERVFNPWVDMEQRLRDGKIPLFSLESKLPVKDFDILGFSLQYELSYTNVLNILSLSGIPFKSCDRDGSFPLIIAGGSCALNPEPMADFIDLFVIGEAEEVIFEIIDKFAADKNSSNKDRLALLEELSFVEGIYVPLFPPKDRKIKKRYIRNLASVMDLEHWIVPYIEIVHDRLSIEIMRGCPNSCRFCQARSAFYPLRLLSAEQVIGITRKLFKKTGYDVISLLSLSSSDHPQLEEIVKTLSSEYRDKGVSISLPSLRAKSYVGGLSGIFASGKKTTLTFAPEAGTERLREHIGKNIEIEELFDVVRQAYTYGYRSLKLYFMIGLPTETSEDLDGIVELALKLSRMKKEFDRHPAKINISISNFIPKPHTRFQRQAMQPLDELLEKQQYLKTRFRNYRGSLNPSFHDCNTSLLEAILARGDRRVGGVILDVAKKGAKFDAWREFFSFSLWLDAFRERGIDPYEYLGRISDEEVLPWGFIDMGFSLTP